MSRFSLPLAARDQWLARLLEHHTVFVPAVQEERVHWHRLAITELGVGKDPLTPALLRIRAAEPVKSFLFPPRIQVASLPPPPEAAPTRPQVLFGMKQCDLSPMRVHDKILGQGEFADPFYAARRAGTITIVADCPVPEASCFCNLLGGTPYATADADIVLSVVEGGYLVETLSERGGELARLAGDALQPATDAQLANRDAARKAAVEMLNQTNPKPWNPDLPGAIAARMADDKFWRRHASTCVECFGCLMGCPTCYCFLLYDQARNKGVDRTRVWDACYIAAYARVGGGANPRAEFVKRFANRFDCKWNAFKTDHGFYACSGCGRCFVTCMGRIDIRKVLGEL